MTTTKRISALVLTAVLAASPLMAAAKGNDGSNDGNGGLRATISALFHGPKHDGQDDQNGNADNSSTTPKTSDDNGKHLGTSSSARIDARISTLNALKVRVDASTSLSADQKASIDAAINAELTVLANLKAGNGTATSTASFEIKDILKSLKGKTQTLPKAAVGAAVDRTNTIVTEMQAFGAKLNTRISAAQTAGTNVAAAQAAYADYNAKLVAAKADADAAASLSASVVLNSTDPAVIAANHTALVNARAKIDDARTQLKAARKDVGVILKSLHINASATASSTVEAK